MISSPEKEVPVRKILLAALLCGSALALSPSAHATGLSTTPDANGAMLIPTYFSGSVHVIPAQYYWRHHRHWRRHHWHRHWR
jgi:hypothetical protein